ncbi:MAG: leucine/isoleucine/valine transporter permease subunit [Actinobacteria bacterium]|nr:leucine/isoleucine/valine transporter permease subunit [Actinomycetota bacterium]
MRRLPRYVRVGLLGGFIIIYLTAVGMIAAFHERNIITGVVQFSVVLMTLVYMAAGYLAARAPKGGSPPLRPTRDALIAGAVGGVLVGVFVILMTVLADAGYTPRDMFIAITPATLDILSFDQGTYLSLPVQAVFGAVLGLAGGYLSTATPNVRSTVTRAISATLIGALGAPLFSVMMAGLGIPSRWLFRSEGLTIVGTVFVVGVTLLLRWYLLRAGGVRNALDRVPGVTRKNVNVVTWVVVGVVLAVLPWIVNTFVSDVLGTVGLYILLGLGLNIVVGYAGLLDLGYVAFYAVGAYSVAVLTARSSFLVGADVTNLAPDGFMNFWVAIPLTIVLAVIIGVLIGAPVLRLRGDYLAIVTLGFGEIIRTLVLSDWLKPYLGGPQGITEIPSVPVGPFNARDPRILYYLILGFVLVSYFVSTRLKYARIGRAWAAMREDEDVAEGMGISVIKYKILAFVMGAAVGCLGGAFFAAKLSVANPGSFTLLVSINVLAVVVLGGMGSIPGVVVGSLVLVGLPELLREFGEFRLHIYGIILVAIMVFKPEGLFPDARRARELRGEATVKEPVPALAGAAE